MRSAYQASGFQLGKIAPYTRGRGSQSLNQRIQRNTSLLPQLSQDLVFASWSFYLQKFILSSRAYRTRRRTAGTEATEGKSVYHAKAYIELTLNKNDIFKQIYRLNTRYISLIMIEFG
jgi:hypothetical protein